MYWAYLDWMEAELKGDTVGFFKGVEALRTPEHGDIGQTDHFVEDLSYCSFVDETSLQTWPLLTRELVWLSGILEIEKETFWEALFGARDRLPQYAELSGSLGLDRYDESIISGGLISGFNGCCSALLETLEGDQRRDLAIATRMCSI